MYKGGAGSGTSRGVVVLDKSGVCRVLFQGGVSLNSFWLFWFALVLGDICCCLEDSSYSVGLQVHAAAAAMDCILVLSSFSDNTCCPFRGQE